MISSKMYRLWKMGKIFSWKFFFSNIFTSTNRIPEKRFFLASWKKSLKWTLFNFQWLYLIFWSIIMVHFEKKLSNMHKNLAKMKKKLLKFTLTGSSSTLLLLFNFLFRGRVQVLMSPITSLKMHYVRFKLLTMY